MSRYNQKPDLGEHLKACRGRLIEAWENRVRAEIEEARNQDKFALHNLFPTFIDELAALLSPKSSQTEPPCAGAGDVCEEHGHQRARFVDYSLTQILHEYSILRQLVFEFLEEARELTKDERNAILAACDLATREAGEAFFKDKTEGERQGRRNAERERDGMRVERDTSQGEKDGMRVERDTSQVEVAALQDVQNRRERFVAILSHDLRNPIGTAKMALDILATELPQAGECREMVTIMARNLTRAESLLQDLLDANRLKSGRRLSIKFERCSLRRLVEESFKDLAVAHGDRFRLKADGEALGYWSAPYLARVIENLASNAAKYGDGKAPITVRLRQDDRQTTLIVHNVGPVIAPADQATLFDPHVRAKAAEAGQSKGWGLGLTLARGVVEAHGGQLAVESTAEAGTTFTAQLPNDSRPYQVGVDDESSKLS